MSSQPTSGRRPLPSTSDRSWGSHSSRLVAPCWPRTGAPRCGGRCATRPASGGSGGGTFTGPYPNAIAGMSGWWDAGHIRRLAGCRRALRCRRGIAQRRCQRRRQVRQRQPARGIPRHRQHAAAGDATPERSARRRRAQHRGSAGDAAGGYYLPQWIPIRGSGSRRPISVPASGWTWYLVWSRPNWRQGSVRARLRLLIAGGTAVLQADGVRGAGDRLMLFSGSRHARADIIARAAAHAFGHHPQHARQRRRCLA